MAAIDSSSGGAKEPVHMGGKPKRGAGHRVVVSRGYPVNPTLKKQDLTIPAVKADELDGELPYPAEPLEELEVEDPEAIIEVALKGEAGVYPSERAVYLKGTDNKVYALVEAQKDDEPLRLVEMYWPPVELEAEVIVSTQKAEVLPEVVPLKLGEWFDNDWFPYVATSEDEGQRRLITHVVLEPDVVDKQGDIYSAAVIEAAAHDYLANYNKNITRPEELGGTRIDVQHYIVGVDVDVVESWIAPIEMTLNGQVIKKGTWIVTLRVRSDALWADVLAGSFPGISIGGMARLVLLNGFKMPE